MSITAQLRQAISVGGLEVDKLIALTQGNAVILDEAIADSTTDGEVACDIDISQMEACIIMADGGDMTLETNNGGTPDDTINLEDGKPFLWYDKYLAAHFSADITALFMTNSSGSSSTLKAIFIVDPTV
jgi:hypothetical protein